MKEKYNPRAVRPVQYSMIQHCFGEDQQHHMALNKQRSVRQEKMERTHLVTRLGS
jgi:hypothetical protein